MGHDLDDDSAIYERANQVIDGLSYAENPYMLTVYRNLQPILVEMYSAQDAA